jgi:hypothetical protein
MLHPTLALLLATTRIEDVHREAAQMHTLRLARSDTREPPVAAAGRVLILSGRRWAGRRDGGSRGDRAPMPQDMRSETP